MLNRGIEDGVELNSSVPGYLRFGCLPLVSSGPFQPKVSKLKLVLHVSLQLIVEDLNGWATRRRGLRLSSCHPFRTASHDYSLRQVAGGDG